MPSRATPDDLRLALLLLLQLLALLLPEPENPPFLSCSDTTYLNPSMFPISIHKRCFHPPCVTLPQIASLNPGPAGAPLLSLCCGPHLPLRRRAPRRRPRSPPATPPRCRRWARALHETEPGFSSGIRRGTGDIDSGSQGGEGGWQERMAGVGAHFGQREAARASEPPPAAACRWRRAA